MKKRSGCDIRCSAADKHRRRWPGVSPTSCASDSRENWYKSGARQVLVIPGLAISLMQRMEMSVRSRELISAVLLLVTTFLINVDQAEAQLRWRVSVKFVLDSNGNRAATGDINTDAEINAKFDAANEYLASTLACDLSCNGIDQIRGTRDPRGYSFLITEIVDVPGVSQWFTAPIGEATADGVEDAALADPETYSWRTDAINVYILGTMASGYCSSPGTDSIIIIGQELADENTPFHECGHFFDLCHTHGCSISSDCTDGVSACDDDVSDTLLDNSEWDTCEQTAIGNFGVSYTSLAAQQQLQVDETVNNLMGYHDDRCVLTPDQLDRMTDASNGPRFNVATGRTRFVDHDAGGTQSGSSAEPFSSIGSGLAAAADGDIVLIRAGTYAEMLAPISQQVYLRSSRGGVVIGAQ